MTKTNSVSKVLVAGALSVTAIGTAVMVTDTYQANHGPSKAYAECDQFKNDKHPNDKTMRCYELRNQRIVALQKQFTNKNIHSWSY